MNEAFYIEKIKYNEDDDDLLIIRVVGADNMDELLEYLKKYDRKIH